MKEVVYMATNKYEQGFTLVSMLGVITILFTIIPFLVFITTSVTYDSHYDEASIQQFYQFLRDEFILSTDYTVKGNTLILERPKEEEVSFMKYNEQVLRKVNDAGHDIYLRNISEIVFKDLSYGVKVKITSLEGKAYEKTVVFYEGI